MASAVLIYYNKNTNDHADKNKDYNSVFRHLDTQKYLKWDDNLIFEKIKENVDKSIYSKYSIKHIYVSKEYAEEARRIVCEFLKN